MWSRNRQSGHMLSHVLTGLDTSKEKPGFTYLAETDWS